MSPGLSDVAVTVRNWVSPTPAVIPDRLMFWFPASSLMGGGFEIGFRVGCLLTRATVMSRVRVLLSSPPGSLTWNRTVRVAVEGVPAVFSYLTDRRAAWYWAIVAEPVRVRTPFPVLKLPVIPFWLVNRRKSWPLT